VRNFSFQDSKKSIVDSFLKKRDPSDSVPVIQDPPLPVPLRSWRVLLFEWRGKAQEAISLPFGPSLPRPTLSEVAVLKAGLLFLHFLPRSNSC